MSVMSTQSTHHLYWCALTMCMVSYAFHKMSRVAQSLSKRRSSAISATRSMRSWWFVAVNLSSSEIFFRATQLHPADTATKCYEFFIPSNSSVCSGSFHETTPKCCKMRQFTSIHLKSFCLKNLDEEIETNYQVGSWRFFKYIWNSFKSPHWPPLVALVVRLQSPEMIQGCRLHPDHSETLLEFTFTWYLNSGYSWIFYDILTWNWFYNWTTTNWHESWHIFMIYSWSNWSSFPRRFQETEEIPACHSRSICSELRLMRTSKSPRSRLKRSTSVNHGWHIAPLVDQYCAHWLINMD